LLIDGGINLYSSYKGLGLLEASPDMAVLSYRYNKLISNIAKKLPNWALKILPEATKIRILTADMKVAVAEFRSDGLYILVSPNNGKVTKIFYESEEIYNNVHVRTGMEDKLMNGRLVFGEDANGKVVGWIDEAAKISSSSIDEILEASKYFDDNVLDIADAGFENWKVFQNRVAVQLKTMYPNSKIGHQIYLDVTYIDNAGKTVTRTIIPDDLIQIESNGIAKYKAIDAKTSIRNDLPQMNDLTSTCTAGQKEIYPLIDNFASGKILKVEMYGKSAMDAFGPFLNNAPKVEIQLENNVEFWVNSSKNDFSQYLIRSRIK
jgi:hypothetical protein